MKKTKYLAPSTKCSNVELEQGFMKASIFEAENEQDDGVSITGHEIGNTGDYTDIGWDSDGTTSRTWGN